MTSRAKRWLGRIAFLAVVVPILIVAQGSWDLGPYSFLTGSPSGPLEASVGGSGGGLSSYDFVSAVGGVAFGGVAQPGTTLRNAKTIRLHYNAAAVDGTRLQVVVDDATFSTSGFPDWMLIPISRYADSRFDACVSLFGPASTDNEYDVVYHSAFQNTLLGLRLLQADILLFNLNEMWRLPRFGGQVVLGSGETLPARLNEAAADRINDAMGTGSFQSWVMTDQGEAPVVDVAQGQLQISGAPYYYFWRSDIDAYERQHAALVQRAQSLPRTQVREHNRLVDQANSLRPAVIPVSGMTTALQGRRDALRDFNPAVFAAATNTMRYAAFFRYLRGLDNSGWQRFLSELSTVSTQPSVTTPTRWPKAQIH